MLLLLVFELVSGEGTLWELFSEAEDLFPLAPEGLCRPLVTVGVMVRNAIRAKKDGTEEKRRISVIRDFLLIAFAPLTYAPSILRICWSKFSPTPYNYNISPGMVGAKDCSCLAA